MTTLTTSISAEEWRAVVGYEGVYEVSDQGRVRRVGAEEPLRPFVSVHYPYMRVRLSRKDVKIHRLVAIAFIPNPDNKPCVDHINGLKTDNRAANLRWATRNENQYNRRTKAVFKGVSWKTADRVWRVFIKVHKCPIYLGSFDDPEEAYHVYCAAAVLYHGDFACG